MTPAFLRDGTMDLDIWDTVFTHNEYRLPEDMTGKTVLDLGAHIGSLSALALSRGASVFAVEACRSNFIAARKNLGGLFPDGDWALLYGAAWRSDRQEEVWHSGIDFTWSNGRGANTGGGWTLDKAGARGPAPVVVPSYPLDLLLQLASDGGRRRVWLKLDIEGAEFPCLLTSRGLGVVDWIGGEYHEIRKDDFSGLWADLPTLRRCIEGWGFAWEQKFEIQDKDPVRGTEGERGHFWAMRTAEKKLPYPLAEGDMT